MLVGSTYHFILYSPPARQLQLANRLYVSLKMDLGNHTLLLSTSRLNCWTFLYLLLTSPHLETHPKEQKILLAFLGSM